MKEEEINHQPETSEQPSTEGAGDTKRQSPPLSEFKFDDWKEFFKKNPNRPK